MKVHVLLDWVGSAKLDKDALEVMEQAGVEVEKYRPLRWYHLSRFNSRTHRKILVVDGKIGFTGGVGYRGPMVGKRRGPRALARLALSIGRPGGRASPSRVSRQLDQDAVERVESRELLS